MTAPLPRLEYWDVPMTFIAATLAKTLYCRLSMNGAPRSTEIGILHDVLEITADDLPSQFVKSSKNCVKSPFCTMTLKPVILDPYSICESADGLVHLMRI